MYEKNPIKKPQMNVFKQNYFSWRYIKDTIRLLFRSFKWAWQRVTRGYCDADVWDLDITLLNYFYLTLNQLADTTIGWPGTEEFETFEDWQEYLRDMAYKFYCANEVNEAYKNPMSDKYYEVLKNHYLFDKDNSETEEEKEITEEYFKHEHNIADLRQKDFAEAWSMMGDVFFHLWD